jgi:thioester reductase-like protein
VELTESSVSATIGELVEELNGHVSVGISDDFFSAGMDSLQALHLRRALVPRFPRMSITMRDIYSNPSIKLLTEAILNKTTGADAPTSGPNVKDIVSEYVKSYETEIDALASARKTAGRDEKQVAQPNEVFLLTGSTGALGSYLLQVLLDSSASHIFCFNRVADSKSEQEKRNASRDLPTDFPPSRVTFLTGDLTRPSFCLSPSTFDALLASVTHVIHNAWPVDFNRCLHSFRINMDGILSLVSFSARSKNCASIQFLSSIAAIANYSNISSSTSNSDVPETVLFNFATPALTGYGQSKYVTERILDSAARKLDIKTSTIRIGQVAGAANTKRGWSRNEWFPSLVVSSLYISALPQTLGSSDASNSIDWIPIDQRAEIVVELTRAPTKSGIEEMYHVLHPTPLVWKTILQQVKRSLESVAASRTVGACAEINVIPYSDWFRLLQEKSTSASVEGAKITTEVVNANPAIKLLGFYEALLAGDQLKARLSLEKTLMVSAKMQALEPIKTEWVDGWVKYWLSALV